MQTATEIRTDGPGAYLVQSSDGETFYQVRLSPQSCQCKGFQYRSKCRHVAAVLAMYQETEVLMDPDEPEDVDEDPATDEVTMCEVYSEGASRSVTSTAAGLDEQLPGANPTTALNDRAQEQRMSTLRTPSLPQIDEAQHMRDARTVVLQRVVARNMDHIFDTFLEDLKALCNDPKHPLAQMLDDLESGPMEDRFDLDGWIKYAPTRDKVHLGEAVMRAAGEAQLTVVEKLLDQAF